MTWSDWNPYKNIDCQQIVTVMVVSVVIAVLIDWFTMYRKNGKLGLYVGIRLKTGFLRSILVFYLYTILCATLFGRESSGLSEFRWHIFWTLRAAVQTGSWKFWYYIIGNILLFLPLGFLLSSMMSRKRGAAKTLAFCIALSCAIELTQYLTGTGLCELDDVMHNTIGAGIGLWIERKTRQQN